MKKISIFFLVAICLLTSFANAQFIEIPREIFGNKITLSPEGDIIISGTKGLIKTDNEGNIIWQTQINASQNLQMTDISISNEGEIYASVNIDLPEGDFGPSRYPGIIKFSEDGDSLWFKSPFVSEIDTCNFFNYAEFNGINLMNNGNIIQTGNIGDTNGNQNLILLISNPEGEALHTYLGPFQEHYFHYGESIFQAKNGNIYIAGYSRTLGATPYTLMNAILACFNDEAELLFLNKYPEDTLNSATFSFSHIPFNDGILLSANNSSGLSPKTTDFLHYNYNGNILNSQSIGADFSNHNLESPYSGYINNLRNGGFIYSGSSKYTPQNTDLGIVARYDSNLNLEWIRAYGDSTHLYYTYHINDIVELQNGKLALFVYIKYAPGNVSNYLIITDPYGNCTTPNFLLLNNKTPNLNEFQVYPNPAENKLHLSTGSDEACKFSIIGLDGRILKTGIVQDTKTLDISEFSSGIVFLKVEGYQTQKVVIK